jgi:hypothetical protein
VQDWNRNKRIRRTRRKERKDTDPEKISEIKYD